MERENHNDAIFFVGPEVETTPAFGSKTLFVVGVRAVKKTIELAKENKCTHIYLGANMSFQQNKNWNNIIPALLDEGFKVTLDYPIDAHTFVQETIDPAILSNRNFIAMISCKLQNVESLNANTCLKIDDVDFEGTNSGVWVLPVTELLDSNRFTGWNEYGHDEVLVRDTPNAKKTDDSTKTAGVVQQTESEIAEAAAKKPAAKKPAAKKPAAKKPAAKKPAAKKPAAKKPAAKKPAAKKPTSK